MNDGSKEPIAADPDHSRAEQRRPEPDHLGIAERAFEESRGIDRRQGNGESVRPEHDDSRRNGRTQ